MPNPYFPKPVLSNPGGLGDRATLALAYAQETANLIALLQLTLSTQTTHALPQDQILAITKAISDRIEVQF